MPVATRARRPRTGLRHAAGPRPIVPVRERTDLQLATDARDLEAVRHQLGIGRWVLEGYSGGSQLALTYALGYPDAVAGLIVGFSAADIAGAIEDPRTLISPADPAY